MKKFVYINIESYEIPSNIDELIIFLEEKVKETGAPRDEALSENL